ncbi:MAG TPA: hypothetical protein VFE55_21430 [Acidimicrobiia bacterium]|nr:hypothetical protein [Acidimicrobiia bacterium]
MIVVLDPLPAEPWGRQQVVGVACADVIGVLTVLASWYGASGSGRSSAQTNWITLGVAGAVLVAAANGLWLLAGRRAVVRRIGGVVDGTAPRLGSTEARGFAVDAGERLLPVATDSMRWYHRPDCPLTAGKRVTPSTVESHTGAGRAACGVCAP